MRLVKKGNLAFVVDVGASAAENLPRDGAGAKRMGVGREVGRMSDVGRTIFHFCT